MVHGSPLPATAPRAFPRGELVFSACRAEACGFVRVDNVRGSDAVAPGKCHHCSVRDWPPTRTESAPTPPQRGLCGYAASPGPVFSAPALETGSRILLSDRGHSSQQERLLPYNVLPQKCGE